MKRYFWILVVLGLEPCSTAWALFDCGAGVGSLANQCDVVVLGLMTKVEQIGCRHEDGSIGTCVVDLGVPLPERALRVQFMVMKVLKGDVGKTIEFTAFVPMVLVGCKGPDLELYTRTLAFLRLDGQGLLASPGDYALCQRTRADYATLVKETKAALQQSPAGHPVK